jgi:hypothetical protein
VQPGLFLSAGIEEGTMPGSLARRVLAGSAVGLLAVSALAATPVAAKQGGGGVAATPGCNLGNGVKRVVFLDFDNVHLLRDNPNVPSDLEQMPHLLNFLQNNGTVFSKSYTILISHTAGGIISTLTGLYPDRAGITVANSYDYYRPDLTPTFSSAFKYWTSPVAPPNDTKPNLITDNQKTTPAPWVTYTRAGCDVANFSVANTVLENNSITPGGDIYNVFGPGSPEAAELPANRTTDFVGMAIHCAKTTASVCTNNANAKDDPLPDEPGGYTGYKALYGAKYVNPAITGGQACVNDMNGNPILGSPTSTGCGFPGFDGMPAANSLGMVAQSLEAGVPVAYAYVSDVHDNHAGGGAYGPGEAGYVAALKSYDDAFGAFFNRLANDGINSSNTLFVVTADENDHFAGQQAQNCDGVTTPCVYNTTPGLATGGTPKHGIFDVTSGGATPFNAPTPWPPTGANAPNGPLVGEVGYNMKWNGAIGPTVNGTGYDISFDSAPSFYINGQPQAIDSGGNLAVNPTLRAFEGAAANLNAFDPYLNTSQNIPVARYLVDYPTLKAIHMINTDPQRNMSFTMFSQPDFYFQSFDPCPAPSQGCVNDSFAWIHGDYSEDIGRTWLGMVGPGVANNGRDNNTWTDHTDVVPTMNSILGLQADYQSDGRVISEALTPAAAKGLNGTTFVELGVMLKQLDAPYGAFNHSLIVASTAGIKADDTTYLATEQSIQNLATQRDTLVDQIQAVLNGGPPAHIVQLIQSGQALLDQAAALAAS